MLQKLNERIQGAVAWVIIILIAITFTLFGLDYYIQSHQSSDVKVVINDMPVSNQAFEVDYRRSRSQYDASQLSSEAEKKLKKNVLNQIITNTVTVQAAREFGFDVKTEQANATIVNIPQFQQDGHFSAEKYQQALGGALYTPETFQKEVQQGMLLNQQRFAFVGTAFALPAEIKRFVRLYMQSRSYSYLTIPASLFAQRVTVSEEAIQDYYKKHQDKFKAPEKVSIDYINLSMQDIKSRINIDDAEVKQSYDENQANYLKPAQWQVSRILFALPENSPAAEVKNIKKKAQEAYRHLQSSPDKFEQMMKTMSDDKLSVANKSESPWIVAGQTAFDKALLGLTESNQISEPVKTKYGFEIFKLLAYKPATVKPFEQVKDTIRSQLMAEKVQARFSRALEELSDLSYQTPDSLQPVAQALNLEVKTSELFSKDGGDSNLTKNKSVINAAFSHDVLELENNSDPIQMDNNTVIVLRINKHIKEKPKDFSEVKNDIKQKLIQQAAMNQAKKFAETLIHTKPAEQKKLVDKYQLKWHQVTDAAREGDKAPTPINDLAYSLPAAGSMGGKKLPNGSYAVVKLDTIQDGKLSALDKGQQKSIAQQIEANYGMMVYNLYVNNLVSKAKIERH